MRCELQQRIKLTFFTTWCCHAIDFQKVSDNIAFRFEARLQISSRSETGLTPLFLNFHRYLFLGNAGPVVGQSCAEVSQQVHRISGHHPASIILPSYVQHIATHASTPISDIVSETSASVHPSLTSSAHVFLVFTDVAVATAVLAALHQHATAVVLAAGLPFEDEQSALSDTAAAGSIIRGGAVGCVADTVNSEEGQDPPGGHGTDCLPAHEANSSENDLSRAWINGGLSTQAALCRPLIAKFAALKVDKVCCSGCSCHSTPATCNLSSFSVPVKSCCGDLGTQVNL